MPQPTGGKVNASNLNVEGLDEVATPLLTDNLMLSRDGAQNEKVLLSQVAAAVIPDPLLLSDGTEAAPSLAFTLDTDTGLFRPGANTLGISAGGSAVMNFSSDGMTAEQGNSPRIANSPPSATTPSLMPNQSDPDTGIGRRGSNIGTLIAGGFNVAEFFLSSGLGQLIVPSQNNVTAPSIAFGDGDTGFYENFDDGINVAIAGVAQWQMNEFNFGGSSSSRAIFRNVAPSATVPDICPQLNDLDTGIGKRAADTLDLICGGQNCVALAENAGAPEVGFYGTVAIPLQTGVAVTAAAIHAALVALGLITA